jgi:hypothetical protein
MEREAGTDLEDAADGGDDGGGEVGSRDDEHLPVPLLHRLRPSQTLTGSGDERRWGWRWIRCRVREEVGDGDGCFSHVSLTCGPSRCVGRSDDSPPMLGRHVRDGTRRLVETDLLHARGSQAN